MPVSLVTGCSSGFGLLSAVRLARGGHTVVATARRPDQADELRAVADGLDIEVVALDVTDEASVTTAVDGLVERHGRLDAVVNNAGLGIRGAVEDVQDAEARSVFETNLFGVLRVCRVALPHLRAQGTGVVVNVSSIGGLVSAPFAGLYSATKFALEAVSESMHYELHPFGVRVMVVQPGGFPTRFDDNRYLADANDDSPYAGLRGRWEASYGNLPGRGGDPPDPQLVAEAVWRAVSDPTCPRRQLVGADAQLIGGLRKDLDDDAFEQTIRGALDFWE